MLINLDVYEKMMLKKIWWEHVHVRNCMQTWKCIKSKKFEREMKVSKCIEVIFVWKKGGDDDVCINNNEI